MPVRRWIWGLLFPAMVACANRATEPALAPPAGGKADGPGASGEVVRLVLEHAAVPGTPDRPNVVVYLPAGLDVSDGVNLVVFLHGHWNCAANVIEPRGAPCVSGRSPRQSYALARQLEAAHKNAILVVPELAYDAADSQPYGLDDDYAFAWLIWEALDRLGDRLAGATLWDVGQIVVVSHSGGYQAAAAIVRRGGLEVTELWLLDSLYGKDEDFDAWIDEERERFPDVERRFADVYTAYGGTLAASTAMADRAREAFADADVILDDRTTSTLTAPQYHHGLLFKRSGLLHDDVPRYYFQKLLETSALPDKP